MLNNLINDFKTIKNTQFGIDLKDAKKEELNPSAYKDHIDKLSGNENFNSEIQKQIDGIRAVLITHAKNRVPLGDDKFNSTEMFKNIIEILKASENMYMVSLQKENNELHAQSSLMQVSNNIGKLAVSRSNVINFDKNNPKNSKFVVEIPENVTLSNVYILNNDAQVIKTYAIQGNGLLEEYWDGTNDNNEAIEDGQYKIIANYKDDLGQTHELSIYTSNEIDEVRYNEKRPIYYSNGTPIANIFSLYNKNNASLRKPDYTYLDL